MKKLLNTLYVTTQACHLHAEGQSLVVKQDKKKVAQFPLLILENIFVFGNVWVSPYLVQRSIEAGVGVSYFTEKGKFLARMVGNKCGNVLVRREQNRRADSEDASLAVVAPMIAAKIANSRAILQRELRNHGANNCLEACIDSLVQAKKEALAATSLAELRGIEGQSASLYFNVFDKLIRSEDFVFRGRNRRPPLDPTNALLSLVYTILTSECASALHGNGLDPYVGFMHVDRPGRLGLALDMVEEFRAYIGDRFILSLINRRQLSPSDFQTAASGAVTLTDDARKKLFTAYQSKKQEEIQHPFLGEKIKIGLLPHCQALLLARHLRGDIERYPPFVAK